MLCPQRQVSGFMFVPLMLGHIDKPLDMSVQMQGFVGEQSRDDAALLTCRLYVLTVANPSDVEPYALKLHPVGV